MFVPYLRIVLFDKSLGSHHLILTMKRINILIFFTISLLPLTTFSQKPEPVIARAFYKFSHQYDTTNTNLIKRENYTLLLGKSSSVYKSYDRALQDSAMLANLKITGMIAPPTGSRANGEELFYYFNPNEFYLKVMLLGNYAVKIPYEKLNWKIPGITKKIANINCQQAMVSYHGRDYIAWFTTDLPFKAGPWKLNGLPGLVISAYDKTGRIKFDFNGFEQVKNSKEVTGWDKKATIITWEDYVKIAKAASDDPQGFFEKKYGGHITSSSPVRKKKFLAPSKSINFPLEVIKSNDSY